MNYFNEELNNIGFKLIEPCKELKPFLQSFWIVKFKKIPSFLPLKIVSDGNSGFIINFSSEFTLTIEDKTEICKEKFLYFPPSKNPAFVKAKKDIDIIGVRFNAAGVYRFFDKDISGFDKNIHIIENSSSWQIDNLYKQLFKEKKLKNKISILESFLLNKLNNSKQQNSPWIFDFINEIKFNKGNINLEELCEEFSLSLRHVQRRFKKEVGLSPKVYCRIIRIQDTKKTLSSLMINSFTSISYDKGFFDQSHFINEFKTFMKETPKQYFQKKLEMAKKFSFKKYKN
ncbi:hypothetical protein CP965_09305 [Halarcobacter mediterraneus]|uniref:HTH araC/xylS-type domain-containing protein n=1 Tax=Halarcobacter mediterraneus TaxID=2023153 RepID=A0A4Q1AX82_9BACT|nr:helix-turn-helix domain-containing protein [Halarcobacter mediterraneus]RXK12761.1 hypothetical protein CP965_09305 [Halarcobacter mediterraneus]